MQHYRHRALTAIVVAVSVALVGGCSTPNPTAVKASTTPGTATDVSTAPIKEFLLTAADLPTGADVQYLKAEDLGSTTPKNMLNDPECERRLAAANPTSGDTAGLAALGSDDVIISQVASRPAISSQTVADAMTGRCAHQTTKGPTGPVSIVYTPFDTGIDEVMAFRQTATIGAGTQVSDSVTGFYTHRGVTMALVVFHTGGPTNSVKPVDRDDFIPLFTRAIERVKQF